MTDMVAGAASDDRGRHWNTIWDEWLPIAILCAIWLVAIFLVDPRGDFPVLDDWSYGRTVKTLLEEGRLHFDGWNTPTLLVQILYGALFCLPFGFSFEALRVATLVAGLTGVLGTYVLLREASARKSIAVVGSLAVMLNPAYLQFSFTFMTDVPFTATAVLSAVFFLRALRGGTARDVALGTVLAVCATLIRDIGVAVPLGYGVAVLVTTRLQKQTLLRAGLPIAITTGSLLLYNIVLDRLGMTPALKGAMRDSILLRLSTEGVVSMIWHTFQLAEALFAHLALFMLPLVLILLASSPSVRQLLPTSRRTLMFAWLLLLLFLCWRFWPPDLPVRIFNLTYSPMEGPKPWAEGDEPVLFRRMIWFTEYVATALMSVFLAVVALKAYGRTAPQQYRPDSAAAVFAFTTAVGLMTPFMLGGLFMERYLIPVLPFAAVMLVALSKTHNLALYGARWQVGKFASVLILSLYGLVAIVYAHDNLLWNRLTWKAIRYLVVERGIEPTRIDGGLSGNGWFLFPEEGPLRQRYISWRVQPPGWWRNEQAEYVVASSTEPNAFLASDLSSGRGSHDRFGFVWASRIDGWLPNSNGVIVVRRQARSSAKPLSSGK